jgi:hypothetical protein
VPLKSGAPLAKHDAEAARDNDVREHGEHREQDDPDLARMVVNQLAAGLSGGRATYAQLGDASDRHGLKSKTPFTLSVCMKGEWSTHNLTMVTRGRQDELRW